MSMRLFPIENWVDRSTTTLSVSGAGAYAGTPVDNLRTTDLEEVTRFPAAETLTVSFGASRLARGFAFLGINGSADLEIDYDIDLDPGSETGTLALQAGDWPGSADRFPSRVNLLGYVPAGAGVSIDLDFSGINGSDVEIGRLLLGEVITPYRSFKLGARYQFDDRSEIVETLGGQDSITAGAVPRVVAWNLQFQDQATRDALEQIWYARGASSEICVIPSDTEPSRIWLDSIYGRTVQGQTLLDRGSSTTTRLWSSVLTVKERMIR